MEEGLGTLCIICDSVKGEPSLLSDSHETQASCYILASNANFIMKFTIQGLIYIYTQSFWGV